MSGSDLWRVAGKGGQAGRIDTVEEMKELFSLLDRKDHDGSARSISADSVQGAAYQALVTEMLVARARANAGEARLAPEAPRVPSQRARETFRQDMQAVKEMTSGLEEHEDIADQVGGGVLKGTHLAMGALEVLETATAVAPELGTVVTGGAVALHGVAAAAGPIVALGAALYEIGEANEAGKRYRENEKRVSAFAAGVASALDPEYSQHQPPHGELRAMYDKGRAFVAGLLAGEGAEHVRGLAHALAVDLDDHVARGQAGLGAGGVGAHAVDQHAGAGGAAERLAQRLAHVVHLGAQAPARGGGDAVLEDVHLRFRPLLRQGEASQGGGAQHDCQTELARPSHDGSSRLRAGTGRGARVIPRRGRRPGRGGPPGRAAGPRRGRGCRRPGRRRPPRRA